MKTPVEIAVSLSGEIARLETLRAQVQGTSEVFERMRTLVSGMVLLHRSNKRFLSKSYPERSLDLLDELLVKNGLLDPDRTRHIR
jgi:hypothetical protein